MTQQAEPVQEKQQPGPPTVAVRYGFLGWVGQFRHDLALKLKYSDRVVIKTERGMEIGTPVSASCAHTCPKFVRPEQTEAYVRCSGEDYLQRGAGEIVRIATAEDLVEQRRLDAQVKEKLTFCSHAAVKANLEMDMIACEHLLGGERIIFYFNAEGRIDFRQLVRDLAREYHTRIEMRQIGARDEARIVADLEICGRECCCKNFLKVLRPVNMKMAKMQKATLDPTKVSGRCGRLRCCLRYEQLTYEELDAKLPDVGIRVRVEQGIGVIRERQVITQILVLDMGEGRRLAVPLDEIKEVLGRDEGQDSRPRRRSQDSPDESGEVSPSSRRVRREASDDQEDRLVSRQPAGQEEGGVLDAPAAHRRAECGEQESVPLQGAQGDSQSDRLPGPRRPDGAPPGQDRRRDRRDGRQGRRGRPDDRAPGREGGMREAGPGQQGARRDSSTRPDTRREGSERPSEPRGGRSGSAPRGDEISDASEGAPRDESSAAQPASSDSQVPGNQSDGSQSQQQGRPGRRRRRRHRPRSE